MYFGHIVDKDSVKCPAPKNQKKKDKLWQEQAQSAAQEN